MLPQQNERIQEQVIRDVYESGHFHELFGLRTPNTWAVCNLDTEKKIPTWAATGKEPRIIDALIGNVFLREEKPGPPGLERGFAWPPTSEDAVAIAILHERAGKKKEEPRFSDHDAGTILRRVHGLRQMGFAYATLLHIVEESMIKGAGPPGENALRMAITQPTRFFDMGYLLWSRIDRRLFVLQHPKRFPRRQESTSYSVQAEVVEVLKGMSLRKQPPIWISL